MTIAAPAKLLLFGDRPRVVRKRLVPLAVAVLLPVAVIISIEIPDFIEALNRSRQKHTMAGIRDWAIVLESAQHLRTLSLTGTSAEIKLRSAESLSPNDGWGRPYRIRIDSGIVTVTSAGRDGIFETRPSFGAITTFDQDIVFSDGGFVQYPEGI